MSVKPNLPWWVLGFTLLWIIAISGCTSIPDPESSQDFNADIVGTISPDHSIGQTIISRRARLNGITLWLEANDPGTYLTLELFHTPTEPKPIFSTTIFVDSGTTSIAIPPQLDPPNQRYFFRLSTTLGDIHVLGREEEIYPYGSAYQNDRPIQGDLAFRATYDYDLKAAISDIQGILKDWWLVLAVLVLLFVPGWLLLDISNRRRDFDPGEQVAMSIGLSAALTPVLLLWTTTLGLPWHQVPVRIAMVIILLLFVVRLVWNIRSAEPKSFFQSSRFEHFPVIVILILIFAASYFVRFAMIRDLAAPAWVDSIHHSLITNGILESGGYPEDYLPHIPVEAKQYHPGYHSLLAAFHWLTGLSVPESMLFFGQVLNAWVIFSVYLLTTTLLKDKKAGLVAALITGLLTIMPAYYTSWGRYTQLTGLLVLPSGFRWMTSTHKIPNRLTEITLGGILLAGLFLLHYRVLIFLGCLALAYWIGNLYRPNPHTRKRIIASIGSTGVMGISGLIFSLPWLIPTLKVFVFPLAAQWRGSLVLNEIHWNYLTPVFGIHVMILAGVGLLLGIFQKRRFSITVLVWVILLIGIANPRYFHLPFPGSFVNQTSVEITVFMPISVLGGYAASQVLAGLKHWMPPRWNWVYTTAVYILGIGISIWGAQRLLPSLNPATILFREADEPAMAWIQENIPEDETIVINPTRWGYGLYMGNDGGFWISPLTDRVTMPPNVLYGYNKEYRVTTNQFVEELLPVGENAAQVWELLQEYGFRHIYIGGRGGVISPQSLTESQYFKVRYHNQSIWVFEANEQP